MDDTVQNVIIAALGRQIQIMAAASARRNPDHPSYKRWLQRPEATSEEVIAILKQLGYRLWQSSGHWVRYQNSSQRRPYVVMRKSGFLPQYYVDEVLREIEIDDETFGRMLLELRQAAAHPTLE